MSEIGTQRVRQVVDCQKRKKIGCEEVSVIRPIVRAPFRETSTAASEMSQKYKNKTAVITGSAGGLGKEFARRLLLEGASVCISDVNAGLGFETLNEFSDEFGRERVCFVKSDVTSMDDWEKYFNISIVL